MQIGDIVYQTDGLRVYESKIRNVIFETDGVPFDESAVGRSIYLTRAESEAALAASGKEG